MRKDHNIFYLALYVGSAVGMVGSGIAVFLYQMLGTHTDFLNLFFGLFVLFFFVFLIVNIVSFVKILMILYKDKKLIKASMITKNRRIKKASFILVSTKNAIVGQVFCLLGFLKKTKGRYKKAKDINKKNDSPIKKRKVFLNNYHLVMV